MMIELGSLAGVAFVTMIIVQMIKDIEVLKKVPTKLVAMVVAMIVNFAVLAIEGTVLTVGVVCYTILSGFIVAYISFYGFDTFKELKERFMNGTKDVE